VARDPLALEQLYDGVVASMLADGIVCEQPFGRRAHTKQVGDVPRICWAPGDPNGRIGVPQGARRPGGEPGRPLALLRELFTCRITSWDKSCASDDPGYERAQYVAARSLFDAWFRAVYLKAFGMFEIVSVGWDVRRNESQRGASIEVVGAIQAAIPDADVPDTGANALQAATSVTMANVTEIEIAPGAN
jgi:hypothetical protein